MRRRVVLPPQPIEDIAPPDDFTNVDESGLEDVSDYAPEQYGGRNEEKEPRRNLPSVDEMNYILETVSDVPLEIRKTGLWAILSRHMETTNIETEADLMVVFSQIERMIRSWTWEHGDEVSYSQQQQCEFYAKTLARKSKNRGERILLTTSTNVNRHVAETPESEPRTQPGFFSAIKNSLFPQKRGR